MKIAERILSKIKVEEKSNRYLEVSVSIARKVADYIKDGNYAVRVNSTNAWTFADEDEKDDVVMWIEKEFGKEEIEEDKRVFSELDKAWDALDSLMSKLKAVTKMSGAKEDINDIKDILSTLDDIYDKLEDMLMTHDPEMGEAMHYNTKMRQLEGKGSRKIRLAMQEAKKMNETMMDMDKPAPYPADTASVRLMEEAGVLLEQAIKRMYEVKDTKKKW